MLFGLLTFKKSSSRLASFGSLESLPKPRLPVDSDTAAHEMLEIGARILEESPQNSFICGVVTTAFPLHLLHQPFLDHQRDPQDAPAAANPGVEVNPASTSKDRLGPASVGVRLGYLPAHAALRVWIGLGITTAMECVPSLASPSRVTCAGADPPPPRLDFVPSKVILQMITNLGYTIFLVFGTINVVAIGTFAFFIPETKGRLLEDIDVIFGALILPVKSRPEDYDVFNQNEVEKLISLSFRMCTITA
ncbi:hypothetical protein H0H81_001814 [Sphagnurus paluster]|uniref:Uncharacterized protein n=1 Tax=Sphagnurus paluster TaxID=117069 RepID=A0A9P7KHX1_9AGAR|nr:hypothetical protein H0H81_001814 [Sphagnurus paluster]